ncbi:ThuA domain-containing protein [Kibdelosporangium phytohabitans]|uniref:ThuA domain-containing protein n=1 Tax=Kibdelosporangium phytohabitans TaxID=860235 RepID=UPI001A0020FC|nr:type 1 glutamine amidotransferase [Kibdelosporangium phytohabitans]
MTGTSQAADPPYRVMVFSKTAGFRHDAIPAGIQALRDFGSANNFTVDATEDSARFTTANLAQYKVVVFLNTTGDVLNGTQQTAFEQYIAGGGGYVGVHAAADTEYDWPFYGGLVGAYFHSHPAIQQVTVRVDDHVHPSTAHLPGAWVRTDELYNYRTNPRGAAKVLARLDESTYSGGNMGADHPIVWCQNFRGGRSWYSGLGHTQASYSEVNFRTMLLGGIRWVAGMVPGDCAPDTQPGPTLLSRGRPATASSAENATYGAANAVDGNTGTRWSSQFADPQWISVDLGQTRSVSRVRLQWEAAYARAYRIETSADNANWSTVNTQSASDGGTDDIPFTATNARYVRVYGNARATAWGYSLWEFEVYGT